MTAAQGGGGDRRRWIDVGLVAAMNYQLSERRQFEPWENE